jgi:5'-nucleotidase
MAVSLCIDFAHAGVDEDRNYAAAAKMAVQVFQKMRSRELPKHTLLNLNVPDMPYSRIRGVRLARQGFRYYSGNVLRRKDHRGRDYFWVGGKYRGFRDEPETDCVAVEAGYASLTPVKLDSTDLPSLVALSEAWPSK